MGRKRTSNSDTQSESSTSPEAKKESLEAQTNTKPPEPTLFEVDQPSISPESFIKSETQESKTVAESTSPATNTDTRTTEISSATDTRLIQHLKTPSELTLPNDDSEQKRLELKKLKYESSWWVTIPLYLSPLVTLIVGGITWGILSNTGLLDATRQNLDSKKNLLEIQQIEIERKIKDYSNQLSATKQELTATKNKLSLFEDEESAIQFLSRTKENRIGTEYSLDGDFKRKYISLRQVDDRTEMFSLMNTTNIEGNRNLAKSLDMIRQIRDVKGIRLRNFILSRDELALLSKIEGIETLAIEDCKLNKDAFLGLSSTVDLKSLRIVATEFSLDNVNTLSSIEFITIIASKVDKDAIRKITECFPNTTHLRINSSNLNDDCIGHFKFLTRLQSMDITGTLITESGLDKLCELHSLTFLYVDQKLFTKKLEDKFRSKKPNQGHLVSHDPKHLGRRAWYDASSELSWRSW